MPPLVLVAAVHIAPEPGRVRHIFPATLPTDAWQNAHVDIHALVRRHHRMHRRVFDALQRMPVAHTGL